ncbi:MAG TPA: gluconeogenesis factor YvcK family protein [Candidatus Saccharimonadales bacterium]|nr:gluconeogenesis factor YvcK family protein [Candidatus Saccharimonadales bacterium]
MKNKRPKVVVIGGGTGTFVVLSGLKNYPVDLTAIVTMMDSGGSTGRLRDQLGVLPPGDLRQALVALSSSDKIWRDLFSYRFDAGDLDGHNFGNIFLSALEKASGSIVTGIDLAEKILETRGNVVPVTLDKVHRCVRLKNKKIIEGETFIDEVHVKRSPIEHCYLKPQALPNPEALRAIEEADFIIIGPGDLYTSIIPNLLVTGIAATLKLSKGKKIYVSNLMTKFGQTDGYKVSNHLAKIDQYIGKKVIDYVFINSAQPDRQILKWYESAGDVVVVKDDMHKSSTRIVRGDFLNNTKYEQSLSDRLKRSLIRHDSEKLAKALVDIFFK